MDKLNKLIKHAEDEGISIHSYNFNDSLKGLYVENNIFLDSKIETNIERRCILAEELGHHHTASSNILDQSTILNQKIEYEGRAWGYKELVKLENIIEASKQGIRNSFELAEFLNVTEDFLNNSLEYYRGKFGTHVVVDDVIINLSTLDTIKILASNENELKKYIVNFKKINNKT